MVPIEVTHGIKVWRLNRVAWFAVALVTAFAFWHVLLVNDEAGFKSVESGKTLGAMIALGVCVAVTAGTWFFFHYRKNHTAGLATPAQPNPDTEPVEPGLERDEALTPEEPAESDDKTETE
jgi:hypothetical protein